MTNDTDVASGKRLLKYSEKLDEEVKKFSQLGDYAKNLEIVSLSKQEKTFANSPEGKAMANMVNEAIGKLANGKTPTDKATEAVNNGTSTNTTSTEESKSGATSDGTKVRSLTMNVHITNTFKAEDDNVLHKVKKQIGDALVDAARDGMTTIGV